jgi:hypothetical protein
VSLEHAPADLDLIVLGSAVAGGCDVDGACLGASSTMDEREQVRFDAVAGATYYIAVEASERQAFSAYALTVECP